ncbi:MAG: hypothetical protein LC100_15160 [Chitinophagales bacterium]|nr:hypothetical protein [Chitinophagales bacterium]
MTEKCYSLNEEDFYEWEDLMNELEQEELQEGTEYFEADKVDVVAHDYVKLHQIDYLLESLDEWVYEDIGEVYNNDFYNVSKEAKQEIVDFLLKWTEKHVNLPYWKVKNVVKKVITKEDLE